MHQSFTSWKLLSIRGASSSLSTLCCTSFTRVLHESQTMRWIKDMCSDRYWNGLLLCFVDLLCFGNGTAVLLYLYADLESQLHMILRTLRLIRLPFNELPWYHLAFFVFSVTSRQSSNFFSIPALFVPLNIVFNSFLALQTFNTRSFVFWGYLRWPFSV